MSNPQTTPFSLFLHENMDTIRIPFMSPDKVIEIAEQIWEHMPHELKFSYFKKAQFIFIERNQYKYSSKNQNENYNEDISIKNMIKNLYNIGDDSEHNEHNEHSEHSEHSEHNEHNEHNDEYEVDL
jgi:hypothetical protein